ncbi:MAG TPA: prepilin-type N-terminal cleavage/methylation domain-containing protein [Sulfurimonas sp.]|nr:prepilin-type N-terminal cleavage/methylation domain-containing protein [Sulfurimonas sp.]
MKRRAFSLMELMLVVVIIGVVYAMALSSLKPPEKKELEAFSLLTLPKYLRENFALQDAKIVCFEPCGRCSVLVDGDWQDDEIELFDSSGASSFSIDIEGFAKTSEFAPHDYEDGYKQACFILHKKSNDSIDPIILEENGRFIYYKAAYEKVQSYETLSAIQTAYQKETNIIRTQQ